VIAFAVRRLALAVVMLLALTFVTFVIFYAIPAEPGRILVGEHASRAQVAEANHRLGADRPLPVQYWRFVVRLVHGDFGVDWAGFGDAETGPQHVGPELVAASGVTASLVLGGALVLLLLAVPLGTLAAYREGTRFDRLSTVAVVACVSLPTPVIGLLLQSLVAQNLQLAPTGGYCDLVPTGGSGGFAPLCGGPRDWASHLILPWLTFAFFFAALYMGITRTRMIDVLREPFIRTARAKGVREGAVARSHALPNAMLPLMTMVAMDIGTALGLSVYIETVFGLPGLGHLWLRSLSGDIGGFDLPVILALVVVTGTVVIVFNLAADLLYGVIDPRVREGEASRPRLGRI
jgi:peptide/nickel transport system permease protein